MRIIAPLTISTAAGTLVSTNVGTALDPAAYAPATAYALAARAVEGLSVYQSTQAANTGHLPSTSPDWWVRVGAINSLLMFDGRIGSQTVNADTIDTVAAPGTTVDTVSVRNVFGRSATLTMTDPIDGLVFEETKNLVEPVANAHEYWFNEVVRAPDVFFLGLPPFANAEIRVVIDNTGSDAKCGALIFGRSFEPGQAEYGLSDGINDYSVIRPDPWGILDVVERPFSDEMEMTVWVDLKFSARFKRILTERRAKPTLFIGADSRPDTQVFGLASFRRVMPYFDCDVFTVTVKGMT